MVYRPTRKELLAMIESIEARGGDATELRRAFEESEPEVKRAPRSRSDLRDEEEETTEERLARRVGYLFPDGITPELVAKVIKADESYSMNELKTMCRESGLSLSGDKKELAAKLIAEGLLS